MADSEETGLRNDANLAFAVRDTLLQTVEEQMGELAVLFPFKAAFGAEVMRSPDRLVLRMEDRPFGQVPTIGSFGGDGRPRLETASRLLHGEIDEQAVRQDRAWYSARVFTYVGRQEDGKPVWSEIWAATVEWANAVVLPHVLELNRLRVARAIPPPPTYDVAGLLAATVVVDDHAAKQGTAFQLSGVGFVTCNHVIGPDSRVVDPRKPGTEHELRLLRRQSTIDLAVFAAPSMTASTLEPGKTDRVEVNSHVAVVGYPNYQLGDTGVFIPGIVVGFRVRSSVRRLLTNAYIIGGMSGGPAIGADGRVVGVAVTGADRFESADDTEERGLIPIEALELF